MPKVKNKGMTFVRYGGLSPVKQKGFRSNPHEYDYHTPPARKGIYAFPEYWVEMFLLGGDMDSFGVKNRVEIVKDKDGNPIHNRHPLYDKMLERGDKYWSRNTNKLWPDAFPDGGDFSESDYISYVAKNVTPRKFTYNGPIWHHLEEHIRGGPIMKKRGEWVLTDMDIYKKAFKDEMKNRRKEAIKDLSGMWNDKGLPADAQFLGRNPYKWHSKDHLEVFIERIK